MADPDHKLNTEERDWLLKAMAQDAAEEAERRRNMTKYKEATQLLRQNLILLGTEREPEVPLPMNSVLYSLSKALLLLTESVEADLSQVKKSLAELQPPRE